MLIEATYLLYIVISIALTVWVARTLSTNGRIFLVRSFADDERIADSVNHLLVVGFYLINLGYVTLALQLGEKPESTVGAIEFLSTKIGLVMLVLGAMHFFNVFVITKWGKRAAEAIRT
jgi:hypothetical protein